MEQYQLARRVEAMGAANISVLQDPDRVRRDLQRFLTDTSYASAAQSFRAASSEINCLQKLDHLVSRIEQLAVG
jgi:UDP:flavonoid glycosyltransferase YjiC (YdhE family)